MTRNRPSKDDTTRYLCAAAQLDADFADDAIREFLVERTRPVPPSPGTDATAVLGEAIAARARRKIRDGILAALAVAILFTAPFALLVGWVVVGLIASISQMNKQLKTLVRKSNPVPVIIAAAAIVVLIVYGPDLYEDVIEDFFDSSSYSSSRFDVNYSSSSENGGLIVALVMMGGMLATLITDRLIVWRHLTRRFNWNAGPIADPLTDNRPVLSMSGTFMRELRRIGEVERESHTQDGAAIVVYRGFSPFVGAGMEYGPWSVAVPLRPLEGKEQKPLTTDVLYAEIRKALSGLGRATPLTPSERLSSLRIADQVMVPADELIDHLADPASRMILKGQGHPPYPRLSIEDMERLRAEPEEWARYYLCVQVETWDRELVLSVFIHAAMDDTTLYVEWTPYVLLPIKQQYQEIDQLVPGSPKPVFQALRQMLRLPITILPATVKLLTMIRPVPQRPGFINPHVYGSLNSLRELAADDNVHNYLQLADVDRYLKILSSRFVPAVTNLLEDSGFSAEGFERQTVFVDNRNVHIGGSVGGSFSWGNNVVQASITTTGGKK
ncbi:hypothetical protein LWC34_35435 [Kibdelosporangium philippinense]|uniref:Uncharacterized protein n=1 Tax=Kibdelosporangium philippinense TaxID=211113 RepID=A0ABS8ZJU4_9PSEU|nr:hypothetical protein [Kibdelosporangium philippinense]MCE7008078.1 hypothetical protein [Kibdelosporangium philippinense]